MYSLHHRIFCNDRREDELFIKDDSTNSFNTKYATIVDTTTTINITYGTTSLLVSGYETIPAIK